MKNIQPSSWVSTAFTEVLDIQGGTQPPKSQFIDVPQEGYVRLLQIRDFGLKPVPTYIPETSKLKKIEDEDILIGRYGASLGRICTGMSGAYNVALAKVISPNGIHSKYLQKYLESQVFQGPLALLSRSAQNGFNKSDLATFEFPLPPLAEQKAIAQKLDTLLAQVETTKARLDRIPDILKRFRQSVLAAAVSGKLTEEWRGENAMVDSWKLTIFSDICREITVGFVGKMADKYKETGVPFLRSQNVRAFRFSNINLLYISHDFHKEIYKSRLEGGDLAIVRSGAPGTTCVIPESLGVANCSDLVIARPSKKLNSEFGCIFMNSEVAQKNVAENQVGVAQQHFNVGSMKKMPIDLPTIEEQAQIVKQVNTLLAYADTIENQVIAANKHVNSLTQSILAKAFRGELTAEWRVENPELINGDNSAEALLAKIKLEREALGKLPKKKRNMSKKGKDKHMSDQIIKVVEALKQANEPLNGQQLLTAAGYPSDSSTEQLEQYFLDIRDALVQEKSIVKIRRSGDGLDWFALTESTNS